jgi:hypothetical protein
MSYPERMYNVHVSWMIGILEMATHSVRNLTRTMPL